LSKSNISLRTSEVVSFEVYDHTHEASTLELKTNFRLLPAPFILFVPFSVFFFICGNNSGLETLIHSRPLSLM
jgi:hypothetical protein